MRDDDSDYIAENEISRVEDEGPCARVDLPDDPDYMCADCGRRAGDHPAWGARDTGA
jgi:hypothetical protein